MATVLGFLTLSAWIYLVLFHGRFWHADQRLNEKAINVEKAPSVVAVIPARDEAAYIGQTVRSLLDQDYPGPLRIIVVDDGSTDGTAEVAKTAARDDARLDVIAGAPLADGWVGKMWAVKQGIEAAGTPEYLLLTDADIRHAPTGLSSLVQKAEVEGLVLVSLMVRLNCRAFWEKLLVPAFVYFFQKLYPFPRVNDPAAAAAAAAGGCMLVRREELAAAGGVERIRDRIIDDCALAALLKPLGPIWVGLARETVSLRAYDRLGPVWRMVARTAYVQLRHNPLWLVGTVLGMWLLYAAPPLLTASLLGAGPPLPGFLGLAAWGLMWWTYLPTLELYRLNAAWALLLPVAGMLYALMTVDSARRHYSGAGGDWKGRTYGS